MTDTLRSRIAECISYHSSWGGYIYAFERKELDDKKEELLSIADKILAEVEGKNALGITITLATARSITAFTSRSGRTTACPKGLTGWLW